MSAGLDFKATLATFHPNQDKKTSKSATASICVYAILLPTEYLFSGFLRSKIQVATKGVNQITTTATNSMLSHCSKVSNSTIANKAKNSVIVVLKLSERQTIFFSPNLRFSSQRSTR